MGNQTDRRSALVTGAGRGIGRGIAIELARRGFDVALNDIVAEPGNLEKGIYEVEARIKELGRKALPLQGDVGSAWDRERVVGETLGAFGRIDLLVNNAGIAPPKRLDVLETTEESYDLVLGVNLKGPFFLTQLVARHMVGERARRGEYRPRIVFITSISAYVSSPARAEYCISKAGLSMAGTIFADRLVRDGILVFEIRPGIIATDMTKAVKGKYDGLIADGLVPQRRWGEPEDIARAVGVIAAGDLDFSTGQVIEVGGGFHLRSL